MALRCFLGSSCRAFVVVCLFVCLFVCLLFSLNDTFSVPWSSLLTDLIAGRQTFHGAIGNLQDVQNEA